MKNEVNKTTRGRPSLLDNKEKLISDTLDYIANHAEYDDLVPSTAGLAFFLGAGKSTVYDLAKKDQDFSDTLSILQSKQERMLVSGGLSNQMNATITKLMMCNHGYSEKVDNTSSDGSMTPKSFTPADYDAAKKALSSDLENLD